MFPEEYPSNDDQSCSSSGGSLHSTAASAARPRSRFMVTPRTQRDENGGTARRLGESLGLLFRGRLCSVISTLSDRA